MHERVETGDAPPVPQPIWLRLGWFIALWVGGVAAVALVGLAIKLMLRG